MGDQIRSDAVYHGINQDKETDVYVRCSRCGFICKPMRDVSAPEGSRVGWGINYESYNSVSKTYDEKTENYQCGSEDYDTIIPYNKENSTYDSGRDDSNDLGYDGIERTIYDPIQKQGCPKCGTLLY